MGQGRSGSRTDESHRGTRSATAPPRRREAMRRGRQIARPKDLSAPPREVTGIPTPSALGVGRGAVPGRVGQGTPTPQLAELRKATRPNPPSAPQHVARGSVAKRKSTDPCHWCKRHGTCLLGPLTRALLQEMGVAELDFDSFSAALKDTNRRQAHCRLAKARRLPPS